MDSDYATKALAGDHGAGARIIRLLEDRDPTGLAALRELYPHTGAAYLLGITGPPGAGKSTLVDRIVAELRARDLSVGVVAIDPSSPFSGGAILGDRIRMSDHAADPNVFMRSMATRGHLGGLSRASFETVLVLDAMGFDVVLIETVGVGQDEVEVVDLAHTTAVVSLPGMGDEVQAMKAGILEIGDVFVVNKADLPNTDRVVKQLRMMLELRRYEEGDWRPPIQETIATNDDGVRALVDAFFAHRDHMAAGDGLAAKSARRDERLLRAIVKEKVEARIFESGDRAAAEELDALQDRRTDPYTAAERLVRRLVEKPDQG